MKKSIEVEIRSFLTKREYDKLVKFFNKKAKQVKHDFQETHYLDLVHDLRIQQNKFYSKVWMKKGKMHKEFREELEIILPRKDFKKLQSLFSDLGYDTKVKWLRKRINYLWKGITVSLDYSKGYGYIIELEKMVTNPKNKKAALKMLNKAMKELGIKQTSKSTFDKKLRYYEKHWKKLIGM